MSAQKKVTLPISLKFFIAGFAMAILNGGDGARAGLDSSASLAANAAIANCPNCEAAAAAEAQAAAQNSPLNSPGSNNTSNLGQVNRAFNFFIKPQNETQLPPNVNFYTGFTMPATAPQKSVPMPSLDTYTPPQASFTTNCTISSTTPAYVICPDSQGNVDSILPPGVMSAPQISVQSLLPALPDVSSSLPVVQAAQASGTAGNAATAALPVSASGTSF